MNTYQACLQSHANCVACSDGAQNLHSLQFKFTSSADNKVTAYYRVDEKHQGYTNLLHGGIAGPLLDAAMTHCLLSQGIEALTAELNIRFEIYSCLFCLMPYASILKYRFEKMITNHQH